MALCIAAFPVSFIATILLMPLWRWVEITFQLESVGHSGPAEWCYLFIYIVVLTLAGATWSMLKKTAGRSRMSVLRCMGILLPQLLIGLFWAGSHDLLGGWNQTDDAMLLLLALFIMTPLTTLALLVTESVRSFKKQRSRLNNAFWMSLAMILFVEALTIDFYLLTQVRM